MAEISRCDDGNANMHTELDWCMKAEVTADEELTEDEEVALDEELAEMADNLAPSVQLRLWLAMKNTSQCSDLTSTIEIKRERPPDHEFEQLGACRNHPDPFGKGISKRLKGTSGLH
ncbi:unnamed protein product, partial [Mesorhabditis spiculigera]